MRRVKYLTAIALFWGLFGCIGRHSVTPRQNFIDGLNSDIGLKLDEVPHNKNTFIKVVELQNGHQEYWYQYKRTCRYMFEVDPKTQIIVGARYEGREEDCTIVP